MLSVLYLSMFLLCCCIVRFHWYMFCLLVVLVKLSLLAKWFAGKAPLRKPNRDEGIVSTKPRPKSVWFSWFIVLFHSSIVCLSCSPALRYTLHTSVARYSLSVLKVPLNQTKPLTVDWQSLFGFMSLCACLLLLYINIILSHTVLAVHSSSLYSVICLLLV